jgi:hypothetical protein
MPKQYEAMQEKFAKGAKKESPAYNAAQSRAAAIYNSQHRKRPMSAAHPEGAKRVSPLPQAGILPLKRR